MKQLFIHPALTSRILAVRNRQRHQLHVVMDAVGWVDHGLLDGKNRIVFPQLVDGSWMCWSNSTWVLIHVVLQAIKACVG